MHAIDITLLQMRGQKMDYAHCPLRKLHPFPLVPDIKSPSAELFSP